MHCATVKQGVDCAFMSKEGCTANGGACLPIVEKCEGCARIVEVKEVRYCTSYANPAAKWRTGNCNFATHIKVETQKAGTKVNPLKASKKVAHGKKKK